MNPWVISYLLVLKILRIDEVTWGPRWKQIDGEFVIGQKRPWLAKSAM